MQVAPNQISPGENFDVFYFLRNPLDNATYYVRAKLYDVRTGELLNTIALDRSSTNTRLFIKTVQAPPDPAGYGRNIVAIASVYTDSGFTSQADTYEEQEQYYLIKAVPPVLGGGGGVDYRVLREMMEQVVEAKLKKLPSPKDLPEMRFDSLFGSIGVLHRELGRVPKEVFDATELLAQLEHVHQSLASRPTFEKTDLSPVLEAIRALPEQIEHAVASAKGEIQQTGKTVAQEVRTSLMAFEKEIAARAGKGLDELFGRQEVTIPMTSLVSKRESQHPDLSHLM